MTRGLQRSPFSDTARKAVTWAALAAMGTAGPVQAQSAAPAEAQGTHRAWIFAPSVSVQQTFTDNYRMSQDGESDSITRGSLGLHLFGNGNRVRGSLDYTLNGLVYARHSDENNVQHSLSANGMVELIDNWAFVDITSSIAQQQISAFSTATTDSSLSKNNRSETRTLTLSPYVRGQLGSFAQYEGRVTESITRSSRFSAANQTSSGASLSLHGGSDRTLGWSVSASTQSVDYDEGSSTETDTLRTTLSYPVMQSLKLTGIAGVERTDLRSPTKESHSISGLQLDWVPSERTNLSARFENRYFGSSHAVTFSFRTPRTVWSFSDSRDVSTGTPGSGAGSTTVYDLLFRQFTSIEPDALKRDLLVRTIVAAYGLDPNATAIPGFLTAAPTLERMQALSLALVGIRSNLVFQLSQSESQRLRSNTSTTDDFALSGTIRQRGFTTTWGYRLTPLSSANTTLSWQRSRGDLADQSISLRSLSVGWSTQLARRANFSLGARYTQTRGNTTAYAERAVFGNFGYQF